MVFQILISDLVTFIVSIVGIGLSISYIMFQAFRPFHTRDDISKEQEKIEKWLKNDTEKRLNLMLNDYEIANNEVGRRDNVTLLVGSILITSSFLILGNTALKPDQPTFIFSIASIGLFSIWLFVLHETGKKTNSLTYNHMKAIEGAIRSSSQDEKDKIGYDFGNNLTICDKTNDQSVWWLRVRRMFWAIVLLLLSLSWLLLS